MEYRFQVNLSGIIDLLSQHTYSSPQVFIRELLQNGSDAIVARGHLEPGFQGEMTLELSQSDDGGRVLLFRDNGIGLTEEEVHLFLATIGQTSKRDESFVQRSDFIGQFGIGLLSCFVVSDDVVVRTRSAKENAKPIEWRGRADGTYSLTILNEPLDVGTEVRVRRKDGRTEYFEAATIIRLAHHYGSLLRFPIYFVDRTEAEHDEIEDEIDGDGIDGNEIDGNEIDGNEIDGNEIDGERVEAEETIQINDARPPWEESFGTLLSESDAYLNYGRNLFQIDFLDYVILRSKVGDVSGVAFILPFSPSLAMKKTHRVYLKHMLLSEQAEGLLPDWAFFVKCVVNANDLRPTASREAFYEDETLAQTRAALGRQLRQHLIDMAESRPNRLRMLIQLHFLSFKALAVEDDEFFQIFMKWLPFETNMGTTTLTEYIDEHKAIRFVSDLDQFKQIAAIASAQSVCVINAGYVYDRELIQKAQSLMPSIRLSEVNADSLLLSFKFLTLDEQTEVADFLSLASEILQPLKCSVEIRSFHPSDLPALYSGGSAALFKRTLDETKELVDGFWSSVLDDMASGMNLEILPRLCFNYSNPVVYKVARLNDEKLLRYSIQLLYVQAVLLSHRPLNVKEMALFNEALLGLMDHGADVFAGWIQ